MTDLDVLFRKRLVITQTLEEQLEDAGFRIFKDIVDHGYFGWNPPAKRNGDPAVSYRALTAIKDVQEVLDHVDFNGTPPNLVSMSTVKLPHYFASLPPQNVVNKFPYGQNDIACLHLAMKRGIDLNDIDFVFGGSTLEMLAQQTVEKPYLLCRIPNYDTVLVVKRDEYTCDFGSFGFQFERLVTGGDPNGLSDLACTEHLQVMMIGPYKVLFRAETDAIHDGNPCEIKASNPRYWGTKTMFQMISSGSTTLCQGVKSRGALVHVRLKTLAEIAETALSAIDTRRIERNILSGMEGIVTELERLEEDGNARNSTYRVNFQRNQIKLLLARGRSSEILPPNGVVESLLV